MALTHEEYLGNQARVRAELKRIRKGMKRLWAERRVVEAIDLHRDYGRRAMWGVVMYGSDVLPRRGKPSRGAESWEEEGGLR